MSVVVIYGRELVRGLGLPLVSGLSGDVHVEDIRDVAKRFRELIGEDLARKLDEVFNEALRNEVSGALSTSNLEQEIHLLVERFWARIALPLAELTQSTLSRIDRATLDELIDLEEKLGVALTELIRGSGYELAEDLIYGLSVLIDRDRWIIEKITELGIDGFINRVLGRDPKAFIEFATYTMYLTFSWVASVATIVGIVKDYRNENRDKMARWCRAYAKEIEDYIDTLDVLVKDDVYEKLRELGVVKG
ncbi:MAG: hypothetical protein ACXQTI_04460 [Candidatus Nezhaarchaeales archaeon]